MFPSPYDKLAISHAEAVIAHAEGRALNGPTIIDLAVYIQRECAFALDAAISGHAVEAHLYPESLQDVANRLGARHLSAVTLHLYQAQQAAGLLAALVHDADHGERPSALRHASLRKMADEALAEFAGLGDKIDLIAAATPVPRRAPKTD